MDIRIDRKEMLDRFLSYCRIDTKSDEESTTRPSSLKQLDLLRKLETELSEIGASEVSFDERGYVYATIPENLPEDHPRRGKVPAIGFVAHVDTSPAVTGKNVSPIVHDNYQGEDIVLPNDKTQVVSPKETPELADCIGHSIVTTDGTTLLGADNKAGLAEIMTLGCTLLRQPEILHGPVKIGFTSDEEIGKGADCFDIQKFGAEAAYTIDGSTVGEIEDETFCADSATVTIRGRNVHPGYAKGKMINSMKLTAEFIEKFPKDRLSPETTEGREGYIHPHRLVSEEETSVLHVILRDFEESGLVEQQGLLRKWATEIEESHPGSKIDIEIKHYYRNMKPRLNESPQIVDLALEAVAKSGLEAKKNVIRGGTDGAVLTAMGLPTPNIFTGAHNFHSKREWVSVNNMEKTVETLVHLTGLWMEKGKPGKR